MAPKNSFSQSDLPDYVFCQGDSLPDFQQHQMNQTIQESSMHIHKNQNLVPFIGY